jgi:hypothetical protein
LPSSHSRHPATSAARSDFGGTIFLRAPLRTRLLSVLGLNNVRNRVISRFHVSPIVLAMGRAPCAPLYPPTIVKWSADTVSCQQARSIRAPMEPNMAEVAESRDFCRDVQQERQVNLVVGVAPSGGRIEVRPQQEHGIAEEFSVLNFGPLGFDKTSGRILKATAPPN